MISNKLVALDVLFERDELVLLFSTELFEEFIEVANRPKFRHCFSLGKVSELLDLFDIYGEIVRVTSTVDACIDPKDNFLLALAKDGSADFLITGDEDLIVLKSFGQTEILTFRDFEKQRLKRT